MSKSQRLALPNMPQQWDVSIYDSQTPLGIPDTLSPARREAVRLENAIRLDIVETGAFFDVNGNLITKKAGTANQVRFDPHELVGVTRSLFTHNHPDGLSFSRQDVEQAVQLDLIELRAVTSYCRYILFPDAVWPAWPLIEQALQQHVASAYQEVNAMVQTCQLSFNHIDKELQHRLWVLVSHDLNLHYIREPS